MKIYKLKLCLVFCMSVKLGFSHFKGGKKAEGVREWREEEENWA